MSCRHAHRSTVVPAPQSAGSPAARLSEVTVRHRVLGALVVALAAAAAAVVILALGHRGDPDVSVGFIVLSTVAGLAFAAVGALLVAERPGNALGPILLTAGAALVVEFVLREFAVASDGTTLTSPETRRRMPVMPSPGWKSTSACVLSVVGG